MWLRVGYQQNEGSSAELNFCNPHPTSGATELPMLQSDRLAKGAGVKPKPGVTLS